MGFAHIEVDALRDFVRWLPLEESIELNLQNAVAVAKNFEQRNIHSVITYPLRESDFDLIQQELQGLKVELHAITLFPGLDLLKTNRGKRELTNWESRRIDELYEQGVSCPKFSRLLNNGGQSIEETVDQVLTMVGLAGRVSPRSGDHHPLLPFSDQLCFS